MSNVFGNPITNATLEAMADYVGKDITAFDRAQVAVNMKSAGMKDTNARTYVENLKKQWGNGVSTLCMVYNASGNSLTYLRHKDWHGHIGPAPYPMLIQNGQWGAFLHVKKAVVARGSESSLVYRGKKASDGNDCDYMMAWLNPWNRIPFDNAVWAETRAKDYFTDSVLDDIKNKMAVPRYSYTDTWQGQLSIINTGSNTSPLLEAMFTVEGAMRTIPS